MTAVEKPSSRAWSTRQLSISEDDTRFYLGWLKPFRLAALQHDPDAFSSTYAREVAFSDQDWLDRLRNPLATTFVAVDAQDDSSYSAQSIVGSVTLFGPVPSSIDESDFARQSGLAEQGTTRVYHLTGVYTGPASRGRGIGKSLVQTAVASVTALEAEKACHEPGAPAAIIRADVYASNAAGRRLYSTCGFSELGTAAEPREDREDGHVVSMFRLAAV
ncbi:GNAT family N-acetyltransferase [Microdochium nivale]|nr:GNAT family N-acetyltransferase [Microdochium nivale]